MELTITKIRQTPTVKSFIFEKPPGFNFQPGQFMRFTFPLSSCDERCNSRPFSLASSPTEDYLMITTRFGPSALKQSLKQLNKGTTIRAVGPLGRFTLDEGNNPIVMLVGGIGITPLRSMLKYLVDKSNYRRVLLLYSNKTTNDILYGKEIDHWARTHDWFTVVHTLTNQEKPPDLSGTTGRIDEAMIKQYILNINNTQFYISGPPNMVNDMERLVEKLGAKANLVHSERFVGY